MKKMLFVLLLGGLLAACGPAPEQTVAKPTRPRPTSLPVDPCRAIKIISSEAERDEDTVWVRGVVENKGTVPLSYVQIEIKLLSGGATINSRTWYIDSTTIAPGAKSAFDGFVDVPYGEDVDSARSEVFDCRAP